MIVERLSDERATWHQLDQRAQQIGRIAVRRRMLIGLKPMMKVKSRKPGMA